MSTNHMIYGTIFPNTAAGWRELARAAGIMPAEVLADICQWNDPNGEWCYGTMEDEGLTVPEIRDICREQIAAWSADLAD